MAGGAAKHREDGRNSKASGSHATKDLTLRSQALTGQFGGFDGSKDMSNPPSPGPVRDIPQMSFDLRDCELNWRVWCKIQGFVPPIAPTRDKLCTLGREVLVALNTFQADVKMQDNDVYQYDVKITPEINLRKVTQKIWSSKAVQSEIGQGKYWMYDGNKIAWSQKKHDGILKINVDLNVEEGRKPHPAGKNRFTLYMKCASQINWNELAQVLARKWDYSKSQPIQAGVALNFLDHLMHQFPRDNNVQVRKSFFAKQTVKRREDLGSGVEVAKGVYASMRISQIPGPLSNPAALTVNVDVSNCCFWARCDLVRAMMHITKCGRIPEMEHMFSTILEQRGGSTAAWSASAMRYNLRKLHRVRVYYKHHRKQGVQDREYSIKQFLPADPVSYKFELKPKEGEKPTGGEPRMASIRDYFNQKYGPSAYSLLPVVEMTNKDVIPVEALELVPDQRYVQKLDERQTSNMIKFAVTPPAQRWQGILQGLDMLNWSSDPWLKQYGLKIKGNRTTVKGRILPCPEVHFAGGGRIDAKTASGGRWRIDGKRFVRTNADSGVGLKSWGVCVINAGRGTCITRQQANNFIQTFVRIYKSHGGVFQTTTPHFEEGKIHLGGEFIANFYNNTGNAFQARPELLFFVVPDKNTDTYGRIKKSCDCRFGVVSQVVQSSHIVKCQDQYISNVCMKVNAKLGGGTSRAVGSILPKMKSKIFMDDRTLIIGADVSHASPGVHDEGSMACLTFSQDQMFNRYAAAVETNGDRIEIINPTTMRSLIDKQIHHWQGNHQGKVPEKIIYFRDGVSQNEYSRVLSDEIRELKLFFDEKWGWKVEVAVIVATKRHHIRFFPEKGDRNGNPLPGTIVEQGCTDPNDFDWYCCSHVAIKGTARPVHYYCIMDEIGLEHDALQQFIFEQSFQYARSTTPVSIFPAIYYAHLASNRGKCHKNQAAISSGKKAAAEKIMAGMDPDQAYGEMYDANNKLSSSMPFEIPPLMPMPNAAGIDYTMWYI